MTATGRRFELSVERSVPRRDGRDAVTIRLSTTFSADRPDGASEAEPRSGLLSELLEELDRAIAENPDLFTDRSREDRPLAELLETYRPRQRELVELLAQDGELTAKEADALRGHLATEPGVPPAPSTPDRALPPPVGPSRPIAAAPLENDRTPTVPRPVSGLIEEYDIQNLKQAGAVRARRQISYEEYMSLKRHFTSSGAAGSTRPDAPAQP